MAHSIIRTDSYRCPVSRKQRIQKLFITGKSSIQEASNFFFGTRKITDFEKLGIGGLDAEFNQIFRRAFASRIWPAHVIKQMGINHVRGMLLYGPPGENLLFRLTR